MEGYAGIATQADLAVRNVRVLARGTIRAVRLEENVPPEVAEAVGELAAAVRALADVRAWLAQQQDWTVLGDMPSPIEGGSGNVEFLLAGVRA